jgi:arylsulfatase
MGGITEIATSAPACNSLLPNTCAPLAEILKLNGYSTVQFGKCHEVPVFEATSIDPFHHWPTRSDFQHFYGFIGGENKQSNWLPSPRDADFSLYIRAYWPNKATLDEKWTPPAIQRTK